MFIIFFGLIGAVLGLRRANRINGARIDKLWLTGLFGILGMILGLLITIGVDRSGIL